MSASSPRQNYDIKKIQINARGNWRTIFESYGMESRFLSGKNGPCPLCGGDDRWRWDNKNGDGGGFCHQCDLRGSGLTILGKWLNLTTRKDFPRLLEKVASSLGSLENRTNNLGLLFETESRQAYIRDFAESIWNESTAISKSDKCSAFKYLEKRNLCFPLDTVNIRSHTALEYRDQNGKVEKFPAIISRVTDLSGRFLGIHRIYIDSNGNKAPVKVVKMALGKVNSGAVHFGEPHKHLCIAEGIETALAIRELTGNNPVWAALSATNLANLTIPASVKFLYIYGDHDRSGTGERAAHTLARKMHYQGIDAFINIPTMPIPSEAKSIDWLDFLVSMKKAGLHRG